MLLRAALSLADWRCLGTALALADALRRGNKKRVTVKTVGSATRPCPCPCPSPSRCPASHDDDGEDEDEEKTIDDNDDGDTNDDDDGNYTGTSMSHMDYTIFFPPV